MLSQEKAIVFFPKAAEKFQGDNEKDDSNARASKHSFGSDVP